MGCGCGVSLYTPVPACTNCLQVNSQIVKCDDAPNPCGDTVVIDLAFADAITPRRQSMVKYNLLDAQRHDLSNTGLQWNQIRYHGLTHNTG